MTGVAGAALAQPVPRTAPISGAIAAAKGGEQAVLVSETALRRAEVRQQLKAGDTLRTNAAGTLAIVFADRTQIRLGRNSVLLVKQVTAGVPSALQLQQGSVWGRSPRGKANLSVETPSATAAIRGTDWALTVSGDATALQVFDGAVSLTNGQGAVNVAAGQAARATLGQAPVLVVLADAVGREQMLYFVQREEGLDLLGGRSPAFAAALRGEAAAPSLDTADPLSYVGHGFLAAYGGDLRGALRLSQEGLARYPDEPALYALQARTALLLGDPAAAEAAVEKALARNARDAAALTLRAQIKADYRSQPYAALADAEAAIAADPSRSASYAILSQVRLERAADKEALDAILAALERDPQNPELHARHAQVLLGQNRVHEAKAAIDRALALDPSRATARAALSQYLIETGQIEAARDEVLAASADNPGYARALTQLAEIEYRLGDETGALQQLDAADRLDPESPLTPVARTAIALHSYRVDDAIAGSREALRRFRARGGVYSSLSENRITGSYAAQAFRFAGMDEWARFYGDRVFDSYTPSSYFDQALNRLPDPTFVAPLEGIGFDVALGKSIAPLSSFLQGLVLDPLAVTYPKRRVQFFKEAFTETSVAAAFGRNDDVGRPSAFATLDGLTHSPFPIAYSITAGHREIDRRNGAPASAREENAEYLRGWLGAEVGAYDNLAAFVDLERLSTDEREAVTGLPAMSRGKDAVLFGFWNHKFGDRDVLTVGVGHRNRTRDQDVGVTAQIDRSTRFTVASASYQKSLDRLDLEAGLEAVRQRARSDAVGAPVTPDASRTRFNQERAYFDARWAPYGPLILQGQVAVVDSHIRQVGAAFYPVARLGPTDQTTFDFKLSAAFEPRAGHWLRAAFSRETTSEVAFTFAPTNPVGLRADYIPSNFAGQFDSAIVRWEGEWNPRVFSSFEYQHQDFDGLVAPTPDDQFPLGFADAQIDRFRTALNIWPGGNVGLSASYAWSDGEGTQILGRLPLPDRKLPYLPRHFVQTQVSWASPARVKVELRQTWASSVVNFAGQRRGDSFVTDASLVWEPLDKRAEVKLVIENLFDAENTLRPTAGRLIGGAVAYRF
ncbi:MAG: FecR domain-containing protein [Alphaproteobacteria bacterium]|nr:FecR domain-containing protein [Alphaproteobacteria bacterium]MBU1512925.1 FecR domain-containing protein [Alphaproteobacteria bacterium]MBU2096634.1 FecR domain-containing protein [Alphaproteobacteria bacterium]MBU2150517.1 FecR domain-containing protein [Alphaproteobacteria bacterium]MBU2306554.1 FecR domain-containing protein [Alphaproteobacteria bacterium]